MSITRADLTLVQGYLSRADTMVYIGNIQVARIRTIRQRGNDRYVCEHMSKSYKSPEHLVNALLTRMNEKYEDRTRVIT